MWELQKFGRGKLILWIGQHFSLVDGQVLEHHHRFSFCQMSCRFASIILKVERYTFIHFSLLIQIVSLDFHGMLIANNLCFMVVRKKSSVRKRIRIMNLSFIVCMQAISCSYKVFSEKHKMRIFDTVRFYFYFLSPCFFPLKCTSSIQLSAELHKSKACFFPSMCVVLLFPRDVL